jgi:hypothetical protein
VASTDLCFLRLLEDGNDPKAAVKLLPAGYNLGWNSPWINALPPSAGMLAATDITPYTVMGNSNYREAVMLTAEQLEAASACPMAGGVFDPPILLSDLQTFFFGNGGSAAAQGDGGLMLHFGLNASQRTALWADVSCAFNALQGLAPGRAGNEISFRYDFLTLLRVAKQHFTTARPFPTQSDFTSWVDGHSTGGTACGTTIDTAYPYINGLSPAQGSDVCPGFAVSFNSTDETMLDRVEWSLDPDWLAWNPATHGGGSAYSFNTPLTHPDLPISGPGKLWVRSTDTCGNSAIRQLDFNVSCGTPTPTVTPTATRTATRSATPTASPTPSRTASPTASATPTASPTRSPTASSSPSPTASATLSASPTRSPTATASPSASPLASDTVSPTRSPTATPSATPSLSPTASATPTRTATASPSATPSPSISPSPAGTLTDSPTATPTYTATPVLSPTATPSLTATQTATPLPSSTATPSLTSTLTGTPLPSSTGTPSLTSTLTGTPLPSSTATPSLTATQTVTPLLSPTSTPTATPVLSPSETPLPRFFQQERLIRVRGLYPNPFSDRLRVYFTLRVDADVTLKVYNVAGEPIQTVDLPAKAGKNEIVWLGDNQAGGRVASGTYILRFQAWGIDGTQEDFWERAAVSR